MSLSDWSSSPSSQWLCLGTSSSSSSFVAIFDVDHAEDLETLLRRDSRKERGDLRDALTCNEVDVILALLRAVYVLLEADLLIARLGGV